MQIYRILLIKEIPINWYFLNKYILTINQLKISRMKTLCFTSFMGSEVLLQQRVFPEITDGHQAFNVISGHTIPI